MQFQPVTDRTLLSTDGIKYTVKHSNQLMGPDTPEKDESHIHSCYEVYVNMTGNVSFLVNNNLYPIRKGNVILTRPGDVHLCVYHAECFHEHFCLWLEAPADSLLVSFMHESGFSAFLTVEEADRDHLFYLLRKLSGPKSQELSPLSRTAYLCEVMDLLQNRSEVLGTSPDPILPEEMQQILTYLSDHFREIQHIKDIYDRFYISPATLNRWFRKYIHISPREFLEAQKLAYAKQLLGNGYTVTEACIQSGFSDCSYFISVFKKKFGTTPLTYKRGINPGDLSD